MVWWKPLQPHRVLNNVFGQDDARVEMTEAVLAELRIDRSAGARAADDLVLPEVHPGQVGALHRVIRLHPGGHKQIGVDMDVVDVAAAQNRLEASAAGRGSPLCGRQILNREVDEAPPVDFFTHVGPPFFSKI